MSDSLLGSFVSFFMLNDSFVPFALAFSLASTSTEEDEEGDVLDWLFCVVLVELCELVDAEGNTCGNCIIGDMYGLTNMDKLPVAAAAAAANASGF